jgi:4'-phosphopantetheinyl transferase
LREILSRYFQQTPQSLVYSTNKNGKPGVQAGAPRKADWRFNFTHSRDLALLAVARGVNVGIDVEWVLKPMPDIYEVLKVVCRPAEVRDFRDLPKGWQQQAFFKLWTIKEAYLKALGTGLSREPDTVHLKIGREGGKAAMVLNHPKERNWQLTTFEPRPGYVATLALQTEKRLAIRHFSWSDQQETGSMGR